MFIVATAGHIDHGKTALVRALTGVDTDRLPEEHARGISIDIGFAYWQISPDKLVAFVDVPGHHRFIRNMLAGVAAIDFALLVVAVDDGPMPQTVEHIDILDFLNVRSGVVVLSKSDKADAARTAQVKSSMADLLVGTSLEQAPFVAVSSVTGEGVAELKALLSQAASVSDAQGKKDRSHLRQARFAIDRVFTVRGAGTIVTGTVYDGEIKVEDRLGLFPAGEALRVRAIQVHGSEVTRVAAGERAALNLAGAKLPDLTRGDWLAPAGTAAGSTVIDVQLTLARGRPALQHAMRSRMHLGTSEVACRVLLPGRAPAAGSAAFMARLSIESPVFAVNGDRFILRDTSASATLAGGQVLDPSSLGRRRQPSEAEALALLAGDPSGALRVLLEASPQSGVASARFDRMFHLTQAASHAALQACHALPLGKSKPCIVSLEQARIWTDTVAARLQADARIAVPLAQLQQLVAPALEPEAFEALLRLRAEQLDISMAGGAVTLRARRENHRSADQAAWERVKPLLDAASIHALSASDMAARSDVPAGRLRAILHAKALEGEIFQLRPDKFLGRDVVAKLAAAAAKTASSLAAGEFTAAQYRDTIGTGRTLAIHVLEMLDAVGITQRRGEVRAMARQPDTVFGHAVPFFAHSPPEQPPRAVAKRRR